jgi:uncharacterized protein (DUF58 family)
MILNFKRQRTHWTHIRLPLAGVLFLLIAFLLIAAASKSQASLVFISFGIMIGAISLSVLWSARIVKAIHLRRDLPDRAWQNHTVHLGYQLRNVRKRTSAFALTIRETQIGHLETADGFCVHLPPQAVFHSVGRMAPKQRGWIALPAIEISSAFPFGLIVSSRVIDLPAKILIWPARGRLKRSMLYQGAIQTSTAPPSRTTGGQDEFFGLREYRSGDNPRWIHWRRSAGKSVPIIKEMVQPIPQTLWIILDTFLAKNSPETIEHREQLLRFGSTLVDHALSHAYQVGLALSKGDAIHVLPPAEGLAQRTALLDCLAEVDDNRTHPLESILAELPSRSLAKSQVIMAMNSPQSFESSALRRVCAIGRHVTVIPPEELDLFYEDELTESPVRHAL